MANTQLTGLAEDLEKLLEQIKPKPVLPPPPAANVQEDVEGVARAVFEYVLHKAPEGTSPTMLGEALSVGVNAASLELGIKRGALMDAVHNYVLEALLVARERLE